MIAALRGQVQAVRPRLIEREADVNKAAGRPLHYAATGTTPQQPRGHRPVVEHHAWHRCGIPQRNHAADDGGALRHA